MEQISTTAEDYRAPLHRLRRQQLYDLAIKSGVKLPTHKVEGMEARELLTKGDLLQILQGVDALGALHGAKTRTLPDVTHEEAEAERRAWRSELQHKRPFELHAILKKMGMTYERTDKAEDMIKRIMGEEDAV